jgi:hypothetical protein
MLLEPSSGRLPAHQQVSALPNSARTTRPASHQHVLLLAAETLLLPGEVDVDAPPGVVPLQAALTLKDCTPVPRRGEHHLDRGGALSSGQRHQQDVAHRRAAHLTRTHIHQGLPHCRQLRARGGIQHEVVPTDLEQLSVLLLKLRTCLLQLLLGTVQLLLQVLEVLGWRVHGRCRSRSRGRRRHQGIQANL